MKFLVSECLDKFDSFVWDKFFSIIFSKFLNHDELLTIAEFIAEIEFSTEINTTSIKQFFEKAVIEYWSEEIHDDVNDNIEDCSFESIKDEVNKHIKSVLSEYNLELEELSEQLLGCVDLDDIYTSMVDRYSGIENDFSSDSEKDSHHSLDEIDDLFERPSL